jgi:hypothetical protein
LLVLHGCKGLVEHARELQIAIERETFLAMDLPLQAADELQGVGDEVVRRVTEFDDLLKGENRRSHLQHLLMCHALVEPRFDEIRKDRNRSIEMSERIGVAFLQRTDHSHPELHHVKVGMASEQLRDDSLRFPESAALRHR